MKKVLPFLFLTLLACNVPTKNQNKDEDKGQQTSVAKLDTAFHNYLTTVTDNGKKDYTFKSDTNQQNLKLLKVNGLHFPLKRDTARYAVSVAMINSNADLYDLDFYFKKEADSFKFVTTRLHKLNSKEFYAWDKELSGKWTTIPQAKAPANLSGVLKDTVSYIFKYKATLPAIKQTAKVWVPLAQSGRFQNVSVTAIKTPEKYDTLTDPKFGNKALFMTISPKDSGKTILITYKATHWEKTPYSENENNIHEYLEATPLLPVGGKFAKIDKKIFKKQKATTPLTKARALYDYVKNTMRYNKQTKYGTGSANYACDMRTGNCTEFHSLFISLCRTANIPARYFIGASISSTKDEGSMGYHCWAEFFANGKWWPVDISEGYKYDNLADYYFGHNPANRFLISRGRDIRFKNGPQSGGINYFIYPVIEVNGKKLNTKTIFSFKRIDSDKQEA